MASELKQKWPQIEALFDELIELPEALRAIHNDRVFVHGEAGGSGPAIPGF